MYGFFLRSMCWSVIEFHSMSYKYNQNKTDKVIHITGRPRKIDTIKFDYFLMENIQLIADAMQKGL